MDISDAVAGSMLITGTAETTLRLLRGKSKTDQIDTDDAQLQILGRNIVNADTIHLRFNRSRCRFETASEEAASLAAAIEKPRTGTVRARILEALQAAGGPLLRADLQGRLCRGGKFGGAGPVTPEAFRQALQRLRNEKILAEDAEGCLTLEAKA